MPASLLADTLFGRTRRQVLGLLFGHPDESFYVREVARHTGAALGAVQKELAALASAEILKRTVRGRQVYFGANRSSPLFAELASLVAKTTGAVEVIRRDLELLGEDIDAAFIFGSVAKGAERSASDIDLFVIGVAGFSKVVDALSDAQQVLGREVNPVVQSRDEFARRVNTQDHFVRAVLATPRLFVKGNDDDLDRLAGKRLAAAARDEPAGDRRPPRPRRSRSAGQRSKRSKP